MQILTFLAMDNTQEDRFNDSNRVDHTELGRYT